MAGRPDYIDGAPAPLFDRLIDVTPLEASEHESFRVLDAAGLRHSIRREIERLLDTRRAIGLTESLDEEDRTVLEYGIADYTHLSPHSKLDMRLLAAVVETAIRAFEPRLHEPGVRALPSPKQPSAVVLEIEGFIRIGKIMEPVSFMVDLAPQDRLRVGADGAA